MKRGYLNDFFVGVAAKRLSTVEIFETRSHQHEFNVSKSLLNLLGKPEGKVRYKTKYLYLCDEENEQKEADSTLTWYDARERNPNRSEYRLYFPADASSIIGYANTGDTLFLCLTTNDELLALIARSESTIESQLCYLFGIYMPQPDSEQLLWCPDHMADKQITMTARMILEKIGIEYESDTEKALFGNLIDRFNGAFPSTDEFSEYARSTVTSADPIGHPDDTLVLWYDRETALFKMMERYIIEQRLKDGFTNGNGVDVDGFIAFSLSVQNRRKSRAGMALENCIAELMIQNRVLFSRTPVTENRNRPDFLFPGKDEYISQNFPVSLLTMLGSKTTSKDRWRQVLDEADKIRHKHLLTLEGAISTYQTDQMKTRDLQLVVPLPIHQTYTYEQRKWLMPVCDFISMVKERQRISVGYSSRIRNFYDAGASKDKIRKWQMY